MRRTLYTIGRPPAELGAIRQLISAQSGLDATGLDLFDLSAGNDFGRIYYAVCDPKTERGLVFTVSRGLRCESVAPQHLSEWEIKHLFTLARRLGLYKFTMLAPLRLFQDEILTLSKLEDV